MNATSIILHYIAMNATSIVLYCYECLFFTDVRVDWGLLLTAVVDVRNVDLREQNVNVCSDQC